MEAIQDVLLEAVLGIITIILGIIANQFGKWVKDNRIVQRAGKVKDIAKDAVQATQQLLKEGTNSEKFKKANRLAVQELNERGLDFTEEELTLFIESSFYEMKEGFAQGVSEPVQVEAVSKDEAESDAEHDAALATNPNDTY